MASRSSTKGSRSAGWRRPFWARRVKRTPVIFQMEAVECGAASLAIVLAHYGAWIPLEELRIACGVSRDGSKASNVVKAAQRYGLAAKGYSVEPSALHKMPMPCILHWNFNHFVVLEAIDGKGAYINDPGTGRRRVGLDEVDKSFTGVVLAFERSEAFRKRGSKPQGTRLLLRELRNSKAAVALLILVSVALVVPNVVAAGFSKIFVDDILIRHTRSWLAPLLIGMALTAALRAALTIVRQSLLTRLQTKLAVVTTSRFLWRVLVLPLEFFTQRHAGDIANRVAANELIAGLLSGGIASNALSLMSVLLFAGAMAVYDVPLAVLCVLISLLNVVLLRVVARRRQELSYRLSLEQGKLLSVTVGVVQNDRDRQGKRAGRRRIRPVVRPSGQDLERGTATWRILRHSRDDSDVAVGSDDRRDPGPWRLAGRAGFAHARQSGGVSIAGGELLGALCQSRELFWQPADHQGGS